MDPGEFPSIRPHLKATPFGPFSLVSLVLWYLAVPAALLFWFIFVQSPPPREQIKPLLDRVFWTAWLGIPVLWTLTKAVSGRLYLDRLLGPRPEIDEVLALAGPLVALIGFSLGAGALISLIPGTMEDPLPGPPGEGPGAVTFMFFAIALLGPVVEEVLFRGILLQRWAIRWGPKAGLLLSSVLFGLLHDNFLGAGLFGLVAGLLFLATGRLLLPMILHAANNLLPALVIAGLHASGGGIPKGGGEMFGQDPGWAAARLAAGVFFLGVSLPYLVRFIRERWPARETVVPYYRQEGMATRVA